MLQYARMKRVITLSVLVALAFVTPYASVEAATKKSIVTGPIADATVNLYCRIKSGRKTYATSGSGVFIDARGVILTNAHVAKNNIIAEEDGKVEGRCTVRMGTPAKDRYEAEILYFPSTWISENASELTKRMPKGTGENDFALLYVTKAKKGSLPSAFPFLAPDVLGGVSEGDAITVAGYPTEGFSFAKLEKKLPLVAASSTITASQYFSAARLQDSVTIAESKAGSPGISGGPVINASNEVIGIAAVKGAAKDNHTLRAITLPYINRIIFSETGISLPALLSSEYGALASLSRAKISESAVKTLENGLLAN